MKSSEMISILDYLDAEFNNLRMTDAEKATRAKHWLTELGQYDYTDVMEAVRKLSESGFAPRTGQIRAELQKRTPSGPKTDCRGYCRVWKSQDGNYYYDLRFGSAGGGNGRLDSAESIVNFLYWRTKADKSRESSLDYDSILYAHEHGQDCVAVAKSILESRFGVVYE